MDPTLEHLFKTNIPPSNFEMVRLRNLLQEEQKSIDAPIVAYSLEGKQVQARIDAYRLALSPARRVAPELVTDIFLYSISLPSELPLRVMDRRLVITQICSGWRKVALGIPSLWSDVIIDPLTDVLRPSVIEATKTWFDRAYPITLSLRVGAEEYREPNEWDEFVLDVERISSEIIIPYAGRFRELILNIPSTSYQSFLRLPPPAFPKLESFVAVGDMTTVKWSPEPFIGLNIAPSLRKLSLSEFASNIFKPIEEIPWHQLTDLFLVRVRLSIVDPHTILRRCTRLVNCQLGTVVWDSLPLDIPVILHVNLRSFTMLFWSRREYDNSQFLENFLYPLVLPALKILELASNVVFDWCHTFTSLISRSGCQLERLRVPKLRTTEAETEMLLELVPSILIASGEMRRRLRR